MQGGSGGLTPAAELPDTEAAVTGIFLRHIGQLRLCATNNHFMEKRMEAKTKSIRNILIIASVAVIVLAIAAFVAGRYVLGGNANGNLPTGQLGGAGSDMDIASLVKAEELPDTEPEASGTYVRREDNSIFIQTGQGPGPSSDGPGIEIVFTSETLIYRDTTLDSGDPNQRTEKEEKVNQTVELANIEDIEDISNLAVWGERRGDRIFAIVVFFATPFLTIAPE